MMGGLRVAPHELPAVMQQYFIALPDAANEVTDWIETPAGIAVEQIITATHTGRWITPFGELAPTGRPVRWQAVEFVRIHDQRIASWTSYVDQLSVLLGLGMSVSVTPAPDGLRRPGPVPGTPREQRVAVRGPGSEP